MSSAKDGSSWPTNRGPSKDISTSTAWTGRLCHSASVSNQRHRPEQTVLHRTLQEHWRAFVEQPESESDWMVGLPRFVIEEIVAFLRCGILLLLGQEHAA